MQETGPITPRLSMNQEVEFVKSGNKYKVSFCYPGRDYEFEPVCGTNKWDEILRFSEQQVADGLTKGLIK